MNNFQYHRPASLAEAADLLESSSGEAALLAGGQSLLPIMKLDLAEPAHLISVSGLAELQGIREVDGALEVGAATTHAQVSDSDVVGRMIPALADLAGSIGDPQVRNLGTLGGSIAHADPAADYPAALVGLDATVVTDRREITADDFFLGMFTSALEEGEIVVSVRFPVVAAAAYSKFPNPASKYAVVGVFVARSDDQVRVAVTGAGPSVFRAAALEGALAANFAPQAIEGVTVESGDLLDDGDASAEYRAHLVGVLAKRAVVACG